MMFFKVFGNLSYLIGKLTLFEKEHYKKNDPFTLFVGNLQLRGHKDFNDSVHIRI